MNSHELFIHIHQGCFAGTGAIVRLPQCQWSKPDGYGKISQCITTTKHSKTKTVCIFLGIYCTMMTSLNGSIETFSALLTLCAGNSPVTGELPTQRPVTRSFDVVYDLRLNQLLSKQWRCRWFETPTCPLWRHCNAYMNRRLSGVWKTLMSSLMFSHINKLNKHRSIYSTFEIPNKISYIYECGEFIGQRWIPRTKTSDAELWCFLWTALEQTVSINNRNAGNLRRHRAHNDAIVMAFKNEMCREQTIFARPHWVKIHYSLG